MATSAKRKTSQTFSTASQGRDSTLSAPPARPGSKGGFNSTGTSIASTDGDSGGDMKTSFDGVRDKFKARGSDDGNSEGSGHRRRMSKLFKKGRRRSKSSAQEELPPSYHTHEAPPLPTRPVGRGREESAQSEESLGLAKSVSSSLLTEDSDAEK